MMNRFSTVPFLIILFLQLSFGVSASTYGSGEYGDGFYSPTNTPTPTNSSASPTPTTGSGSGSGGNGNSGGGSSAAVNHCGARPPDSNPFLYQVDRLGKKATLYFAPAAMPYDRYVISYGLDENAENYNATYFISNSSGAIDYTVDLLEPGVTYYFKVMAINNCKPSGWSNVIKGEAISPYLVSKRSYFPSWYQQVVHTVSTYASNVANSVTSTISKAVNPTPTTSVQGTEDTQKAPETRNSFTKTESQPLPTTQIAAPQQKQSGNWFSNVVNGFLNIFR